MKRLLMICACLGMAMSQVQAAVYYGPTELVKKQEGEITVHGPAVLDQVKADTLVIMGPLEFKEIAITDKAEIVGPIKAGTLGRFKTLKVTGPVHLKKIEADSLQVIGPAYLEEAIIKGDSVIMGPLVAQKVRFENVTITADNIQLADVTVGNIYVKKTVGSKAPVIVLKGKSTVKGSIQFEAKNGQVILQGKNATIQGKVFGGQIQQKS